MLKTFPRIDYISVSVANARRKSASRYVALLGREVAITSFVESLSSV